MFLLVRRGRNSHWVLFVSAILMFSMATADVIYTWYLLFGKALTLGGLTWSDLRPRYVLYVTTKCVEVFLLLDPGLTVFYIAL